MPFVYILEQKLAIPKNDNTSFTIYCSPTKKEAQDTLDNLIITDQGLTGKIMELYLSEGELNKYTNKPLKPTELALFLKENEVQKGKLQNISIELNQAQNKSVLVLIGNLEDEENAKKYWDSMRDARPNIQLTYCSIAQFLKDGPPKAHYDSIIIYAHGMVNDRSQQLSGKIHRKDHRIEVNVNVKENKKELIPTIEVIRAGSYYSDKIAIVSCHAGTIMKDLKAKPVDANVLALGGAKYPTIMFDGASPRITSYFILNGPNGLYEMASKVYVNTITIQNKDKTISKLGAAKIPDLNQATPLTSIPRVISTPNLTKENGKVIKNWEDDSWWIIDEVFPVEIDKLFYNESLCIAIIKEKVAEVIFWLKQGASANANFTFFGGSPLSLAILQKNAQIVSVLLNNGADPNSQTFLIGALDNESVAIVEELLKGGENRLKSDPNKPNSSGIYPLKKAIETQVPELVNLLLKNGADPKLPTSPGNTPIDLALILGNEEIIALLFSATEKAPLLKAVATEKPATEKPATEKPAAEKPATEKPATEKPATEKPATEKPATEKPATEKPATEKPATEKPATEKPATEKPATEKPATEKPATEKPATVDTPAEKSADKMVTSTERTANVKVADHAASPKKIRSENIPVDKISAKASQTNFKANTIENPFQYKFIKALRILKEKEKNSYSGTPFEKNDAFSKAQHLCTVLEKAGESYFQNKQTQASHELFSTQCQLHIKEARKTLDKHRGFKKIVLNILAIVLSGGLYGLVVLGELILKNRSTFFATDSALKLNKIESSIDRLNVTAHLMAST